MSSQYKLICLSHDPGIEVMDADWQDPETAIGVLQMRTGPAEQHQRCDLVIGRYSYPLIEVACTPMPDRPRSRCGHRDVQWIGAGWLRLLWQARQNDDTTEKLIGSDASCWPVQRLERLSPLLEIEDVLNR